MSLVLGAFLAAFGLQAQAQQETMIMLPGDVPLEIVRIPQGSFVIGSDGDTGWEHPNEQPAKLVTFQQHFHIGKIELTQAQWLALMGEWPGTGAEVPNETYGLSPAHPAYFINWFDAQNFIATLNTHVEATGQGPGNFRLPSETEWTYAALAGSTDRFSFGPSDNTPQDCERAGELGDHAWFCGNNETYGFKPVGLKLPNAFGLYDMEGNAAEWLQDWYHPSHNNTPTDGTPRDMPHEDNPNFRTLSGGSWINVPGSIRPNRRGGTPNDLRHWVLGMRVARDGAPPVAADNWVFY